VNLLLAEGARGDRGRRGNRDRPGRGRDYLADGEGEVVFPGPGGPGRLRSGRARAGRVVVCTAQSLPPLVNAQRQWDGDVPRCQGRRSWRGRVLGPYGDGLELSDAVEMGMRFPFRRAKSPGRPADDRAGWSGVAGRACCCPARPVVKVLIPPALARPHSADLLLCGHHFFVSRAALAAVGAVVLDQTGAVVRPASMSI
jgi:hypothetical protein